MTRTLLKSLQKTNAYQEPTTAVTCIQTHVSLIFLTDSFVYKIKKPVDFGFLNFSTIDRRRFYCNEEVRLNRRLAPEVYLGVVELRDTRQGPSFNGDGAIIDYAVKMKRLPADCMLDRLVDSGAANEDTIRAVATVIARFHATAPTSPSVREHGQPERIRHNWQENFEQMIPFERETLSAAERMAMQEFITGYIEEHNGVFQERLENGFIRECDGDIHLENICIEDGKVQIFDCIEFNDRFRCCDTAADIAFLLMDLDYHGRHDLADIACDQYMKISGDTAALPLITFYRMYRAFVRGKVESFQLHDPNIEHEQKEKAAHCAARYFRLARGYMEQLRQPCTLYITCGLMGSGKSTVAAALAFELGIPLFSSDCIRKELYGLKPDTAVTVPYGSDIYDKTSTEAVYLELVNRAEAELRNGRSVIIDASFIARKHRDLCRELCQRLNIRPAILHIQCKPAENRRRLQQRTRDGAGASDGRLELLQQQTDHFEAPENDELSVILLDSRLSTESMLNTLYDRLQSC